MESFDPRILSYSIVVVVVLGGFYFLSRLVNRWGTKGVIDKDTPIQEALRDGNHYKAGRMAQEQGNWELAARYYIKADRFLDAARAYKKVENWDLAADLFEQGKDYANAALCYRKLGNKAAQLRMLEAASEWKLAAELADSLGESARAAELFLKDGQIAEAIPRFVRAGQGAKAARLQAELLEKGEEWGRAAQLWQAAKEWKRAQACYDAAEDFRNAAQMLMNMGQQEQAAERLALCGAHAEAASLFEKLGLFRKAALNHQRSGDTERAIHCLTLDGDRIAVIKLRMALGQTDEALRIAQAISPSSEHYVEAAQIAASIQIGRGETAAAARTLLSMLDAPMPDAIKLATGRTAAELLLELQDGVRGRSLLDKLAPLVGQGSDDAAWCQQMQNRFAAFGAPDAPARASHASHTSSASMPTIAMAASNAEYTETVAEGTMAYLGALAQHPGGADEEELLPLVHGWPAGVPTSLASRYIDLERLGQGGNGVVFRATDKLLDRTIVLKFMIDGSMPTDIARKYFLREVKLAASLNHPNIVHIYDMGNVDDVLYYAMEYVEGLPLTAHLPGHQPVRDVVFLDSVFEQLCAALDHAHGQGLVHRDIKPDNVIIASDGTVKLLDFGLARVLDDGFGEQSVLAGTPYYMAPEQLDGSTVDHRADIYALGVVLFRMLTGHLPFSEGNIFVAHAVEPVPDPRKFNRDLPDGAVPVVMRCMAKRPAERYSNCRQVALDLHQALFGHVRDSVS